MGDLLLTKLGKCIPADFLILEGLTDGEQAPCALEAFHGKS